MQHKPKMSIVILTFNRCQELDRTLTHLLNSIDNTVEIIVVDNHSVDDTAHLIKTNYKYISYIRTDSNIGTAARNLGVHAAKSEYVITLDDDIIGIDQKDIETVIDIFTTNPKICAINFKVINYFTKELCNWVHHCDPRKFCDISFPTYEITEGAVAFNKTIFLELGGYYDKYFISHEGPDLAYRIMNSGYEVIYNPEIQVFHRHSNIGRINWLNYYYDTRNIIWLVIRNMPIIYGIKCMFKGLISMLIYSIRDRHFTYWIKGTYDGIIGCKEAFHSRIKMNHDTMNKIKSINKNTPSIFFYIKNRMMRKNCRL